MPQQINFLVYGIVNMLVGGWHVEYTAVASVIGYIIKATNVNCLTHINVAGYVKHNIVSSQNSEPLIIFDWLTSSRALDYM